MTVQEWLMMSLLLIIISLQIFKILEPKTEIHLTNSDAVKTWFKPLIDKEKGIKNEDANIRLGK